MLENCVATNIASEILYFDWLLSNAHVSNVVKGNHEKKNETWINFFLDYTKRSFVIPQLQL